MKAKIEALVLENRPPKLPVVDIAIAAFRLPVRRIRD
jgi:hypothetical protein